MQDISIDNIRFIKLGSKEDNKKYKNKKVS